MKNPNGVSVESDPLLENLARLLHPILLPIPTRCTDLGLFFSLSVWYDALLDIKGLDDILPGLEIKMEHRLVF